jgi:hypothetical protein
MQGDRRERRSVSRLIVHLVSSPNAGPVGCFAGTRQTSPLAMATVFCGHLFHCVGRRRSLVDHQAVCRATRGRRLPLTLVWRLPHPRKFRDWKEAADEFNRCATADRERVASVDHGTIDALAHIRDEGKPRGLQNLPTKEDGDIRACQPSYSAEISLPV